MVLNVNPGDTVRITFTLTNSGSPVSGISPDEFFMSALFNNDAMTYDFIGYILSGAMATGESRNFGVNIVVPLGVIIDDYNLLLEVIDPNNVIVASSTIPDAVSVAKVYSVAITNISVTKV